MELRPSRVNERIPKLNYLCLFFRHMKIWLDFCEPKSITMLRPLYEELIKEHEVFITARDFDSTHFLLKKWGVPYIDAGSYGGGSLIGKLKSYNERMVELTEIVENTTN